MKVVVTQDHIDKGIPKNCESCPIALAIKENKAYKKVRVTHLYAYIDDGSNPYEAVSNLHQLPASAKKFTIAFDSNEKVEPFEFELIVFKYVN